MQTLKLPPHNLKIKDNDNGTKSIYDELRRKWLILTPEEYVRQSLLNYFLIDLHFPKGLISIEHGFNFANGKQQRVDILIYNKQAEPHILVECKAPHIKITSAVFEQISRYNAVIKAPYIVISNGLEHFSLHTNDFINYEHLNSFPKPL